jgi:hypothetical protein
MADKIPMTHLEPGAMVLTTAPVGDDFGIPLVDPWRLKCTTAVPRLVRSRHRAQGGTVVWFTDGTKSRPLHGRTAWQPA